MSISKNKPKVEKKINWTRWISILSIAIALLSIGVDVYQTNKINALGKGNLNNDILISSPQQDTAREKDVMNISLRFKSNYDGSIPANVKVNAIKLDGDEIREYSIIRLEEKELIIDENGEGFFNYIFEPTKKGLYEIQYLFWYDYEQGEEEKDAKIKLWDLRIEVE